MCTRMSHRQWLQFIALVILFYFALNWKFYDKKILLLKAEKRDWPVYLSPTFGSQLEGYNASLLSKDERKFINHYMPLMIRRIKFISNYCQRHPELGVPGALPHISWIIRRNSTPDVIWCSNIKVGSGTWTANFLRVAHFNENNPKIKALPFYEQDNARFDFKYGASYNTLSKLFPRPKKHERKRIFTNALRFLVVRHPFTRVLSAYRNKIEISIPEAKDEEHYKEIRKTIIHLYRSNETSDQSEFPIFPEFVQYIINSTKSIKTASQWNRQVNIYWEPYWSHCHVCASDYTVVVKLESMRKDEQFLAILANLKEIKERKKMEWRHIRQQGTSFHLAGKYYKLLKKQQMLDLYNVYKDDFQMFHYNIEKYLMIAKDHDKGS